MPNLTSEQYDEIVMTSLVIGISIGGEAFTRRLREQIAHETGMSDQQRVYFVAALESAIESEIDPELN